MPLIAYRSSPVDPVRDFPRYRRRTAGYGTKGSKPWGCHETGLYLCHNKIHPSRTRRRCEHSPLASYKLRRNKRFDTLPRNRRTSGLLAVDATECNEFRP